MVAFYSVTFKDLWEIGLLTRNLTPNLFPSLGPTGNLIWGSIVQIKIYAAIIHNKDLMIVCFST